MHIAALVVSFLAAFAGASAVVKNKNSENIEIMDLTVGKNLGVPWKTTIKAVHFKLSGRDAVELDCMAQSPKFPEPNEVVTCGNSDYRFSLHPGTGGVEFGLRIYHKLDET